MRRYAIGILRILLHHKFSIDLRRCFPEKIAQQLRDFFIARIKAFFLELDFTKEEIEWCLHPHQIDPYDLYTKVEAIHALRQETRSIDIFMAIAKRIRGIVKDASRSPHVDPKLLIDPREHDLFHEITKIHNLMTFLLEEKNYREAVKQLTLLQKPLTDFFDHVRIEVDDPKTKTNRKALLFMLHQMIIKLLPGIE